MIKYTAFILIVAIRIGYHPSSVHSTTAAFSKTLVSPAKRVTSTPVKPVKHENAAGHDNVFFKWIRIPNESEEKLCSATNLVFGIEKPQTGYSLFFNQAVIQKMFLRIGLLNKSMATTC